MVTADAKMVRHHGQNLQHYVLTLMSIVTFQMTSEVPVFSAFFFFIPKNFMVMYLYY